MLTIVIYNNRYSVIHLVAYGIDTDVQMIEQVWRTYANTLDKDLARSLNKFITYQMDKDEHKREIHNLFDVIEKVKKLEEQERKHRQYSDEKDRDDATQIKDEVNEVEYDDINGILMVYSNPILRDFYVILSHLSIKNNDCRIHPKYEFRTQRFLCNFEPFIHKKQWLQNPSKIRISDS